MDYRSDSYSEWGEYGGSGEKSDGDVPDELGQRQYRQDIAGSERQPAGGEVWGEGGNQARPAAPFLTNKKGVLLLSAGHASLATLLFLSFIGANPHMASVAALAVYAFAYILALSYMTDGRADRVARRMSGGDAGDGIELPPPESVVASLPTRRRYLIVTMVPLWMVEMPHRLTLEHLENISRAIESGKIPGGITSGRGLSDLKIDIPRDRRSHPNAGEILEFLTRAGIAEKGAIFYVINKHLLDSAIKFTKDWSSPSPARKR